jgi:hypothetical protein
VKFLHTLDCAYSLGFAEECKTWLKECWSDPATRPIVPEKLPKIWEGLNGWTENE